MFAKNSETIRNIVLLGQAGSGKTTLAEALLKAGEAIAEVGSTAKGTTVCDFEPQEKAHQHSIEPAVCYFEHSGKHINLIDTPGYPELIGRSIAVLPAADTAAVVIDAHSGIEAVTQRVMDAARERNKCRLLIINKIDSVDIDYEALIGAIRETFGAQCLPLNLPSADGKNVVDCFFTHGDQPTAFSSVEQVHTNVIEQVVEVDEALMTMYLEQGEDLSIDQLHDPFERALREGHLIPICFVSAETGAGIDQLLRITEVLLPNPREGNPPAFLKGEKEPVTVAPEADAHVIGHVFHTRHDAYAGKISLCRVHQGTIKVGAQLYVGDGRKPFKVTHIYQPQGKQLVEVKAAYPGDICAFTKIKDLHFDAVLHDSHDEDEFHLKSLNLPPPMFGLAIELGSKGSEQKLVEALHKLEEEDPSIKIDHNDSGETVLRGLGDLHLKLVLERIEERYGVALETHPPTIGYRETITKSAEAQYRHKKQTGGAGQFGEVHLRIEPLPRGQGFEFVDAIVGGVIPRQYIPAVEKGVREGMTEGTIAGYPITDIKVTVFDGKHHSVDSKEIAFVTAGRKALLEAVAKAGPVLLEPIVELHVVTTTDHVGDVMGDISSRRGRVSDNIAHPRGRAEVVAQAPLSELETYHSKLTAMTGGQGRFTMALSHYDLVPTLLQEKLAEQLVAH